MQSQDYIEILIRLGLTRNEARVYFALIKTLAGSVKEIADATKITRQDIYRILPKLQERGLIEASITNPTKYRAPSARRSIRTLLNLKKKEYRELRQDVEKMMLSLEPNLAQAQESDSVFVLIPAKGRLVQKARSSISEVRQSLRIAVPQNRFWQGLNEFEEARNKALENGAVVRIVTNRTLEGNTNLDVKAIGRNERLKIKFISDPPEAVIILIDEKEVFMIISPSADIRESPALWSNNPSLIALAKDYFEGLWAKAE